VPTCWYRESSLAPAAPEISGDCGFAGSAEIYSPNLASFLGLSQAQLRMLGFYDGGTVFSTAGNTPDYAITGTGVGLRLSWATNFSFSLDWGYVLRPGGSSKQGDSALHFKTMFMY